MMLESLLTACDSRFRNERHKRDCPNCTYVGHCPDESCECEKCLELVHFPTRVADGAPSRKYDCTHMADFYVCKYAHKYVSELIYAFKRLQDLKSRRDIKVLSFGCGPCTDVLALDYLRQSGTYCFETLEYRGIDYGKEVWKNIHANLKDARSAGLEINYYYNDACKLIEQISAGQWVPNLVVFQYFFLISKKMLKPVKYLVL